MTGICNPWQGRKYNMFCHNPTILQHVLSQPNYTTTCFVTTQLYYNMFCHNPTILQHVLSQPNYTTTCFVTTQLYYNIKTALHKWSYRPNKLTGHLQKFQIPFIVKALIQHMNYHTTINTTKN